MSAQNIRLAFGKGEAFGVLPKNWEPKQLQKIEDLAAKLVGASPNRSHGFTDAQPVLIRADAGTGKVTRPT